MRVDHIASITVNPDHSIRFDVPEPTEWQRMTVSRLDHVRLNIYAYLEENAKR